MEYLVVSDNHTFMISQFDGTIPLGESALGLFYYDTRHLSGYTLALNGQPLQLLTSSDEQVFQASILLTNRPSLAGQSPTSGLPVQTIAVNRTRVVSGAIFERIALTNYHRQPVTVELTMDLAVDFADIFLVRGFGSGPRGRFEAVQTNPHQVVFRYQGADQITRTTAIQISHAPDTISLPIVEAPPPSVGPQGDGTTQLRQLPIPQCAHLAWTLTLAPQATETIELILTPSTSHPDLQVHTNGQNLDAALSQVQASYAAWDAAATSVTTDNPVFNDFLTRSSHDLRALTAQFGDLRLPIAGIPWFAVPFGRDSLIASFQSLWFQPELAKGTLRYLARHQGSSDNPWRDEHPGKILHEMRFGELANTNSVPFNPYYGSIDSTLLFLILFGETINWTGDQALYNELLPAALRALDWINQYADLDRDGYIEFQARSEGGLRIQGWKDSGDSVLRSDGSLAQPPIALVEVQAYVYAAKTGIAALLTRFGDVERAARLQAQAAQLKQRFNSDFWLDAHDYYAQAIELGSGPLLELTSNPGHAFLSGILDRDKATRMASRLLEPDLASGWGIRTRASSDSNYNPMSYHNGSVWPHDNSLIIHGLTRSGFRNAATTIISQLFAAAQHFPLYRLPELLCGYPFVAGTAEQPAPYPVSCRPQAWAAGTGLLMLQSILGLQANALDQTLTIAPHLPDWLNTIEVRNLRVGAGRVDFRVTGNAVEVLASVDVTIVA